MPYLLPSLAVEVIYGIYPHLRDRADDPTFRLDVGQAENISIIVNVIEQIPSELITLEGENLVSFTVSLAVLKNALHMWPEKTNHFVEARVAGFKTNAVVLLLESLAKCPDEATSKGTSDLTFISDTEMRGNLRLDISTSHTALRHGEWKPATILAGSVVEALLLWALQQKPNTDIQTSASNLVIARVMSRPDSDILRWGLEPLIEVAHDLQIIGDGTTEQCRLAKDFRNLIHPGRSERLGVRCSRGTAYSAIAAMERVVEDLSTHAF